MRNVAHCWPKHPLLPHDVHPPTTSGQTEEVQTRKKQPSAWCVTVRLGNGSVRYYAAQTAREGQDAWSPRATQAHPFADEASARQFAESCQVGGDVREYAVVKVSS